MHIPADYGALSAPADTVRQMPTIPSPWIVLVVTVPVAADLLGMSPRATYRAIANGSIPVIRFGGAIRVPVAAIYGLLGLPIPDRPVSPVLRR